MNTQRPRRQEKERIIRRYRRLGLTSLVIIFLNVHALCASGQMIPSSRLAPWQGNVGVKNGIPNRTAEIDCTQPPYNAHHDDTDTSSSINECLNGISSGQVAYLPAGTYIVNSSIRIPSNKTLRGAGIDQTILQGNTNDLTIVGIHGFYTDCRPGYVTPLDIISGYTKGSTQLVFADAGTISIGDHLWLDESNDESIPVNPTGTSGSPWGGSCYGRSPIRTRSQIVEVTGKSGNMVNIDPPMLFTFSSGNSPQAILAGAPQYGAAGRYTHDGGVENLSLTMTNGVRPYRNIWFQGTANCWAKNVKVVTCGKRCVDLDLDNFRAEIRDSYFTGCWDQFNSDACYGAAIYDSSSNLIENNVYDGTANGPVVVGSSGNVIAYNYLHGVHRTANVASWFWDDMWTHGSHSSFNLWEGNYHVGLAWDDYFGSSSHNTVFRNRILGRDPTVTYDAYLQEVNAVANDVDNHYNNVVGNIVGTAGWNDTYEQRNSNYWTSKPVYVVSLSGADNAAFTTMFRHMNYDYVSNSIKYCDSPGEPGCQSGDGSRSLPNSLYLSSKPSFFGTCVWPPFGPDLSPMVNTIPAKARYEGSSICGNEDITPPTAPTGLTVY